MNRFTTLLATATISAAPFAATAGGMSEPIVVPAPVIAATPAPTGFDWTGAYVGAQIGNGQLENPGRDGPDSIDFDTLGAHAGYMYDLGDFVVGAEADFDTITFENNLGDVDFTQTRLKLRAGYDLGQFLPYVTAGVANMNITDGSNDTNFSGTTVGLGAVYAVTDNILVGGEYTRNSYTDDDFFGNELDFDEYSLRASYKF